jgi:hypothetical protein
VSQNPCALCSTGVEAAFICFRCAGATIRRVEELRALIPELETQINKQDVGTPGNGGSNALKNEQPLIFNEKASQLLKAIQVWADNTAHYASWFDPSYDHTLWQSRTVAQKARYCLERVAASPTVLMGSVAAPYVKEQAERYISDVLDIIDRKAQRVPITRCTNPQCQRVVMAFDFEDVATCRCGESYDAVLCRLETRRIGRNQMVTADQAIALGEVEGKRFNANTIRGWVRQGLIETTKNARGVNEYRFGDLLDVLSRSQQTE